MSPSRHSRPNPPQSLTQRSMESEGCVPSTSGRASTSAAPGIGPACHARLLRKPIKSLAVQPMPNGCWCPPVRQPAVMSLQSNVGWPHSFSNRGRQWSWGSACGRAVLGGGAAGSMFVSFVAVDNNSCFEGCCKVTLKLSSSSAVWKSWWCSSFQLPEPGPAQK